MALYQRQEDREVTSRAIRVRQPDGHEKDMRFAVRYDRHSNKFYVQPPPWLMFKNTNEVSNDTKVWGETPGDVLDSLEEYCRRYKKHLPKKQKVVLFRFSGHKSKRTKGGGFDHESTELMLRWHVCWEFSTPLRDVRQYGPTEDRPGPIDGDWIDVDRHEEGQLQVLEWTAEREEFFRSLEMSMNNVLERMTEALRSAKQAKKLIDGAKPRQMLLT